MQNREEQRNLFIRAQGWAEAEVTLLAADASFRCYFRLTKTQGEGCVLMDAPPPKEDIRPFMQVTEILHGYNLQAPQILASDEAQGFLLLQDFGDARFTRILEKQPEQEATLYAQPMEALCTLYKKRVTQPHPGIEPYDHAAYMRELSLFTEWWVPHHLGESASMFNAAYTTFWEKLLSDVSLHTGTLVLRDYHADNLMLCDDGSLGLLDYQDALMGDPAYDVVSLLEDARRDVSELTVQACLKQYLDATEQKEDDFMLRYCVLGAQRNLKILGIFMRLCLRDGKAHYLDYIPRVWGHLQRDLTHPALSELRSLIDGSIPQELRGVPQVERAA